MNILIAIVTCKARQQYADAQRATWVKDSAGFDVRFFSGRARGADYVDAVTWYNAPPDEVVLNVDDDYESLPQKMVAVNRWAVIHGYEKMLKVDDDAIIWPKRVWVPTGHYVGWKKAWRGPLEWCAGIAYWLDLEAMLVMAEAKLTKQTAEDHWTGQTLAEAGIKAQSFGPAEFQWVGKCVGTDRTSSPLPGDIKKLLQPAYVAGEFLPTEMPLVYENA